MSSYELSHNKPLRASDIPSQISQLTFNNFNQSIAPGAIPSSVSTLRFYVGGISSVRVFFYPKNCEKESISIKML